MFLSIEEFLESLLPELAWPFTRIGTIILMVFFMAMIIVGMILAL